MFQLIDTFAVWAQAADTRAGMVGAALGTICLGTASQDEALRATTQTGDPLAVVLLVTMLAVSVTAGVLVARVLTPRLMASGELNRASFLSVAAHQVTALRRCDSTSLYGELCEQAWTLARVAHRKYRILRWAVLLTAVAALAFLGWTIRAALLQVA